MLGNRGIVDVEKKILNCRLVVDVGSDFDSLNCAPFRLPYLTAAFTLAWLEIRSRNEEVINSTRNRIYSRKGFYFLL